MVGLCRFQFHLLRVFAACVIFLHFNTLGSAAPVISEEIHAINYLQNFGYLEESNSDSESLFSQEVVQAAIREFQAFVGLSETGELDEVTLKKMNQPRCGVKDKFGHQASTRRKRYALIGSSWHKGFLTYKISKYPRRLKNRKQVIKEFAKAFKVWSDVTNIDFIYAGKGDVDIDIRFVTRDHGDHLIFEGRGGVLAHAFYPQYGGDAHFDDDEEWTIDQEDGVNLLLIAVHEFGHSLGLDHSALNDSVMAPLFVGNNLNFKLHRDDVLGIQAIYGPKDREPAPDMCKDPSIDTTTITEDGSWYVFKGANYWRLDNTGIVDGYPRKISQDWGDLPGHLDATFTWGNGDTYFFKKNKYWRFRNKKMYIGYPNDISAGFEGIPNNVDAAFVWSGNNETYFFKGSNYWRYVKPGGNKALRSSYPKPISNWKGLPDNIDAAAQGFSHKTYFVKGGVFYEFKDQSFSVHESDLANPRSLADRWFRCKP